VVVHVVRHEERPGCLPKPPNAWEQNREIMF
jgi:hypothetical protein